MAYSGMTFETRFAPLSQFSDRGKPQVATSDRLCKMPKCNKYINAGEVMVRWGTFDFHPQCAQDYCDANGYEVNYVVD